MLNNMNKPHLDEKKMKKTLLNDITFVNISRSQSVASKNSNKLKIIFSKSDNFELFKFAIPTLFKRKYLIIT